MDEQKIKDTALSYCKSGNNCAETVLKTYAELNDVQVPAEVLRAVSGLGGGIGRSGSVCGALNSACIVLGLLCGRAETSEKAIPDIYAPIHEFFERWVAKFGYEDCRDLKDPNKGGIVPCPVLMSETAVLLQQFIAEKNLNK